MPNRLRSPAPAGPQASSSGEDGPLGAQGAALTRARSGGRGGLVRSRVSFYALTASALLSLSTWSAQAWEPLAYRSLTTSGEQSILERAWADVIASNLAYWRDVLKRPVAPGRMPPLDVLWRTIRIGQVSYIISIASTRQCEAGANNAGSDVEPDVCEVRVIDAKTGTVIARTRACYVDLSDDDRPVQNLDDRTEVDVNAFSGEIRLRTFVAGRQWSDCSRSVKVR